MLPSPSTSSQKSASGRPPVAHKNLRALPATMVPRIQKSRRAAAPRGYPLGAVPGTCEKPATDAASLARDPAHRRRRRGDVRVALAAISQHDHQSHLLGKEARTHYDQEKRST
jgi:hypothetical protein